MTMIKSMGPHAGCGGIVLYEHEHNRGTRRCEKCGATSARGADVSTEEEAARFAGAPAMTPNASPVTDKEVLLAMLEIGGSFTKALATAAGKADPENLSRIKRAFPEIWREHAELAWLKRIS